MTGKANVNASVDLKSSFSFLSVPLKARKNSARLKSEVIAGGWPIIGIRSVFVPISGSSIKWPVITSASIIFDSPGNITLIPPGLRQALGVTALWRRRGRRRRI